MSTKLTPPRLSVSIVSRDLLLARLDEGLERKLTLLSAPPGFGKTTLVGEWIAARSQRPNGLPVVWVSLDAGDNDPARFWRYVITACRAFDATLGRSALASLRTSQQLSFEAMLTTFINELVQLQHRCVLVLDDYHVVTSNEIHETVTFLLDHLPDTLHLILITRSEPPLPLARLRARNELSELSAADLRFLPAEAQAFLQQALPVPISSEAIARIEDRTEGWVAGLRLVALALQDKSEPHEAEQILATFSGGHRHVLEYLAGEVLATQPEPVQEFLFLTSFLSRLTGSLCDAVTGRKDSADLLEQLERSNLFLIPLGGDEGQPWYRYHTLFTEAMRHYARLRFGETTVRAVQEKASLWYEARGLLDEAIEAAIAAQAFSRAAVLIEWSLESRGIYELHTLRRWSEQLPQDIRHAHPLLCFNYALALLFTSDRYSPVTGALLETPLRIAEEAWRSARDDAHLGQVLALRAMVAGWQGELAKSFAYNRESLDLLPEYDTYWRGISLLNRGVEGLLSGRIYAAQRVLIESRALCGASQNTYAVLAATQFLGEVCGWQGEFDQARQHFQQVLAEAGGRDEMLDDQGAAWLGLSAIALEQDDLEAAEQQASRALEIGRRRSDQWLQVRAALILVRVYRAHGQVTQAQEFLNLLAVQLRPAWLIREVQAWQAWLALAAGDLASAQYWHTSLVAQDAQGEEASRVQQEREALIVARIWLSLDEPAAALEALDGWRADAHAQGRARSELEILCLEALAYFAQSERSQAEQTISRALALAHPKGFRRIFLDEGDGMVVLLQAIIPRLNKRPLVAYATTLLRAFGPGPMAPVQPVASPLVEPLSPQEQRVLRLLVAGLSNPEIARELVVSTNTIKTQVKSIYRKLNVNTREEAKEMARELSLL